MWSNNVILSLSCINEDSGLILMVILLGWADGTDMAQYFMDNL